MIRSPKFARDQISVASFGAVPDRADEGLSDDVFQAALQIALADGHRQFRVPAGTYWLSQGLDITADDFEFVCPDGWATIYQTTYGKNVARLIGARCRVRNIDFRSPYTGAAKTRITNGNITQRYLGEFRRTEASALVIQGDNPSLENIITRNFIAGVRWIGGKERHYEAAVYGASMTSTTLKLNTAQQRAADYWVGARFKAMGTGGGSWTSVVLVTAYDTATNTITWDTPTTPPSGNVWLYLIKGASDGGVSYNHRSYGEDFGRIFSFQEDIEFAGVHYCQGTTKTQGAPPHGIMYGSGSVDGVDDTVDAEADLTPDVPCAVRVLASGVFIADTVLGDEPHMDIKIRNAREVHFANHSISRGSRGSVYLEMVEFASGGSRNIDARSTSANNRPSALEFYDVKRLEWKAHMELASDYTWPGGADTLPAVAVGNPIGRGRNPVNVDVQISGVFRGDATTQYGFLLANSSGYPNVGNINIRKANLRAENSTPITLARIFNTDIATIGDDIDLINVDASTGATLSVQSRVLFDVGCVAGQLVYDSRRTQGAIAVTDEGQAATVVTTNTVRDLATEGSSNILSNGRFTTWVNTSIAAPSSNTIYETATGWLVWRSNAAQDWTATQAAGMLGAAYSLQIQRDVGTTSTARLNGGFQLPGWFVELNAGKETTVLVGLLAGPDWSGGALQSEILYGTAAGESLTTSGASVGTYLTGGGDGGNATIAIGTTARFARVRLTIPTGALSAAVHIYAVPSGTAGAADYFRIAPAALIAGASAKPFSALT